MFFGSPPGKDWLPKNECGIVCCYIQSRVHGKENLFPSFIATKQWCPGSTSFNLPRYLSHTPMDGLFPSALTSLATSKIIIMLAIVHNISENYVKNHWMTKPNPNNRDDPFPHTSPSALTTSLWLNAGWDDDDAIKPKALHSQMYNTIGILVMSCPFL